MDDLAFIDALQKKHTNMVGWMPTKQLEGKIKLGHVIVAEEENAGVRVGVRVRVRPDEEGAVASDPNPNPNLNLNRPLHASPAARTPVGYCIGHDQYFKRDDVGIIYQLNVVPDRRRSLVGATLVKAMFDRAAYGCRLFCCWCAQDIEANHFWESLGFVPLAFRAGSRTKGAGGTPRVHIFWQRRIRAGDTGEKATPYWFPAQTSSGSIREDRLVLPIPPGTHWKDAKPIVLPGDSPETKVLSAESEKKPRSKCTQDSGLGTRDSSKASISTGGLRFASPKAARGSSKEKPRRAAKKTVKNDPRLVAAARELRDRWLEQVNANPSLLASDAKYDVSRALEGPALAPKAAPAVPKQLPEAA
jgi:hypothetical protein